MRRSVRHCDHGFTTGHGEELRQSMRKKKGLKTAKH
jgi:hypothetical protein